MSKAGNRSLFLRLRLVLAAEPELRLAGYLLTKRAELNHHETFTEGSQGSGHYLPGSHHAKLSYKTTTDKTTWATSLSKLKEIQKTVGVPLSGFFKITIRFSVDNTGTRSYSQ